MIGFALSYKVYQTNILISRTFDSNLIHHLHHSSNFTEELFRQTPAYHRAVILPALLTKRQYVVNHQHDFLVVDKNEFSEELIKNYRPNHRSSVNDKISRFLSKSQFILTSQYARVYLPFAKKLSWIKDKNGRVFIQLRLAPTVDLGKFTYESFDVNYLDFKYLNESNFNQQSLVTKAHSLVKGERDLAYQLFEAAQNELLIYESYLFNNQFSIPTLVQRELFLLAFLMLRLDVKNENFSRIASYYLKNEKVWSFQKFEFYDFFKLVFEKNRWQEFDELLRDRKFILANKLDQLVWAYGYR